MNILIVGDVGPFRDYRKALEGQGAAIQAWVKSLDVALEILEGHDGVVCAQSIPTHLGRESEPAETMSGNWAVVSNRARELKIPFLLITIPGAYRLAARFNEVAKPHLREWPAFALVAPVDVDHLAQTICTAAKWRKTGASAPTDLGPVEETTKSEVMR